LVLTGALVLGIAGCSRARGPDKQLAKQLTPLLNRHAESGARVSARVIDLASNRVLYAENIDAPVMPASNMKLVTAATGLDLLGPDHEFETYLAYDGDDLWIIGTGDPAVGDARIAEKLGGSTLTVFDAWAAALKKRGITSINGDIRYYAGAFDNETIHPSWQHDDLIYWYAAPVSGLNFNDNCVDITVSPGIDGEPANYDVSPPVRDLTVINNCVSGRDAPPTIHRLAHGNVIVLGGGCTKRRGLSSKPMIDSAAFFADAFREHLIAKGISVSGGIVESPQPLGVSLVPPDDQLIATHRTKMTDVLWRLLKNSQNLFAECLCKSSGRAFDEAHGHERPGSWASGERAARAFLRENDIDDSAFVGADGSGLSRDNRVTVRMISDLLSVMHTHRYRDAFRAALAEPGKSGTLRSRMKELSGSVFAKTGYIRGVRALSGYVQTEQGDWLCFSIIYNGIPGSVKPFNDIQDEVCRVLRGWSR
jgi:D-alanyl-D-alanine carboxypeptidase/D-alanyl-D-alanine-endopeptidase (penicillin-binding protein 4)